jgi:hypothetical protein
MHTNTLQNQYDHNNKNSRVFFSPDKKKLLSPLIMSVIIRMPSTCHCQQGSLHRDTNDELGPFCPTSVPTTDPVQFVTSFGRKNGFKPSRENTGPILLNDGSIALPFTHETDDDMSWAKKNDVTVTRSYFNTVDEINHVYVIVPCHTESKRRHLLKGVYEAVTEKMVCVEEADYYHLTTVWKACLQAIVSSVTLSEAFRVIYDIMMKYGVPDTHKFMQPPAQVETINNNKRTRCDEEEVEKNASEKQQCVMSTPTTTTPFDKSQHPIFTELEVAADMSAFYDTLENVNYFGTTTSIFDGCITDFYDNVATLSFSLLA